MQIHTAFARFLHFVSYPPYNLSHIYSIQDVGHLVTSLVTNNAATAALATLRSISGALSETQNQVSSGLRISKASDNASYWSIATTMKSDAGAINAVSDALGLGAAKADTAYEGLDSTIDVLTQFKAKLVTAKESSVDRNKVQDELDQLKEQLTSIAGSASFNGENWLNTSIGDILNGPSNEASVVSSFVRDSSGGVTVQSTSVDLSGISLFNSTGGGALQADNRSPGTIGGLRDTIYNFAPLGGYAGINYTMTGPLTFTDDSTAITFDLTVDADDPAISPSPGPGHTYAVTLNRTLVDSVNPSLNGVVSNNGQLASIIKAAVGNDITVGVGSNGNYDIISSEQSGLPEASIQITNVASTLVGGSTGGLVSNSATEYASPAFTYSIFDSPFHIAKGVDVYIPVVVNGVKTTMTLNKDSVDTALGTDDGVISNTADFVTVMNSAFATYNLPVIASNQPPYNLIRYDLDTTADPRTGTKTSLGVLQSSDNLGNVPSVNILDIDITSTDANIDSFITDVQGMLDKVTDAASTVGSLEARISDQSDFANSLSASLVSGVGKLVDADMEQASSKLAAEQTQQQLAAQSLSIANSSSQTILSLFRA